MNPQCCRLCDQAIDVDSADLCPKCFTMAEQINFLIENHSEKARYFLGNKFNEIADRENPSTDRRKNKYRPPKGPHTPDRRVRIRRIGHAPDSPKRRKTDLSE